MNVAAQELHQDSGKSVQIFEINLILKKKKAIRNTEDNIVLNIVDKRSPQDNIQRILAADWTLAKEHTGGGQEYSRATPQCCNRIVRRSSSY